jgi:hypothetical protein
MSPVDLGLSPVCAFPDKIRSILVWTIQHSGRDDPRLPAHARGSGKILIGMFAAVGSTGRCELLRQ